MCVSVRFLIIWQGQRQLGRDHQWVKLNNLDNLKSIDSTICPFSVIALTPISVNGLVHFNLEGLSRCYLLSEGGSGVKQRMKEIIMVISSY